VIQCNPFVANPPIFEIVGDPSPNPPISRRPWLELWQIKPPQLAIGRCIKSHTYLKRRSCFHFTLTATYYIILTHFIAQKTRNKATNACLNLKHQNW